MKKIWEAESFCEAATLYVWSDKERSHPVGFVESHVPGVWAAYEVVGKPQDANRGLRQVGGYSTAEEAKAAVEKSLGLNS